MTRAAAYDEIADRDGEEILGGRRHRLGAGSDDPLGPGLPLRDLLGEGTGPCLEIGRGVGAHTAVIRELGWTPLGVELSAGTPHRGRGRSPVARADAERLPVRDSSVPAVVAVMVRTDVPCRPTVLREVARVLRPGGVFVHIGAHPCCCGGSAGRSGPGAVHLPLPEVLHAFLDAGLVLERFAEGGSPAPTVLAVGTRK